MTGKRIYTLLLCLAAFAACSKAPLPATSTLIENALIIDGTGSPAVPGAVRFEDGRIVAVGNLKMLPGETVIDAEGLALAPGFIDTHSHHDRGWQDYRHMPGVLSQGVTTIVRGADGSSSFGGKPQSVAAFNAEFEASPAAVNVASFSAHNSIRETVLGDDGRRAATADEVALMAALVEADMQNGALGLSTGLEYEPGIFSGTAEVIELAKVAARQGGRYMSHVRDEDDRQMDAYEELLTIGREAGLPVHISHMKLADKTFWGTSDEVLGKLDAARDAGVEVTADIYPYQRWASNLAVLFPERDYTDRNVADFTFEHTAAPEDIVLSWYGPNPEFNGRTVREIASILEQDVESTLLDLALAADNYRQETGEGGAAIIAKGMDEGDVAALMLWEHTNICSDGGHGGGHPRGYGAFPRVFSRFVRQLGVLELEQAVYKMTVLAARNVGISERGQLKPGYFADFVLFDPATIRDHATMTDSTAVSTGVEKVWVNGELAFELGESTGAYPGRVVGRGGQ